MFGPVPAHSLDQLGDAVGQLCSRGAQALLQVLEGDDVGSIEAPRATKLQAERLPLTEVARGGDHVIH